MFEFKPEKLFVTFKNGVQEIGPIIVRTYTMTHSDETEDLFVTVGLVYDYDKITNVRDEVLAEWVKENGKYKVNVYVHLDGENNDEETKIRDKIFRNELPLALTAIRYADRKIFTENKELDNAPITVYFNSRLKEYNKIEDWGIFKDYICVKCLDEENLKNENNDKRDTNKCLDKEDIILNFLNPYIEKQIWLTYRKPEYFCLDKAEILAIEVLKVQDPCRKEFEIAVGLKVGRNPPPYNNMIIEFLVAPNKVVVKSVKNPR